MSNSRRQGRSTPTQNVTRVLCLAKGLHQRDGEEWLDPDDIDWNQLRGSSLRIIYTSERQLRPILRSACASDCRIDLLDANNVDYALVTYDTSEHRSFKKEHGMDIFPPVLHHMPPHYALMLLKDYQRESSEPRGSRSMGSAASGRVKADASVGPDRSHRRAHHSGADWRDAAMADNA